MKMKIYRCPICGNIIEVLEGDIAHITCCGISMELLEANVVDASQEKHLPVYKKDGDKIIVSVGEITHPMDDDHYINWIMMVSGKEVIRINLQPSDEPEAIFKYEKDSEVYAYCNKHGLWKVKID